MWKWTDGAKIKVVLLDNDSLPTDYLKFPYSDELVDVEIYSVSSQKNIENKTKKFLEYVDVVSLIHQVMEIENCESFQIVMISSDSVLLKEMMQNHIGIIYIGKLKKDALKYVPDFTCRRFTTLIDILKNNCAGYAAEVFVSNPPNKNNKFLLNCESKIRLNNKRENKVILYIGGRYYPVENTYFIDDPLSKVVREFKRNYVNYVDDFYDSAVAWINTQEKIDILTYVPKKPKKEQNNVYDRFAPLKMKKCAENNLNLQCILKCIKDYSQKGSSSIARRENVRDAYKLIESYDVTDKTIVILDDVYSTGATIDEIARVLYENHAKKVIAVLLSVNQLINSVSIPFQQIRCPVCGQEMIIKFNHKTGDMFYGCKNYESHSDRKTFNIPKGLSELKLLNKLRKEQFTDLNDEY